MFCVGLDVGGTHARAALIELRDGQARVVRRAAQSTRETTPEELAERVANLTDEVAATRRVESVGIGLAAQLSRDTSMVINAPNLGWRNVPFLERVSTKLAVPVTLANDLDAIAWGEVSVGAARGHRDVLFVYVGTGIGAGVVVNGGLVRGASGAAGELGHAKLAGTSALCGCGQRGCLEAVAGGLALEREAQRLASETSLMAELVARHGACATAIERGFELGDPGAVSCWERTSDHLAVVVSTALALLSPSALVLGGGVLSSASGLRTGLVDRLERLCVEVAWSSVEVVVPSLGSDAGMIGAALLSAE